MQLQLLYITHNYATLITLHHTTLHYATLRYTNYNYSYNYNYTTLHYTTLDYTTLGYTTLHYSTVHDIIFHSATFIAPQHNYNINPTTTTTTTALHHTTSRSCEWGDHCKHCNHSKKHNSNHFSVHQWIGSAIHASQQQLSSPIVSYLWNIRHRLVRHYWYNKWTWIFHGN